MNELKASVHATLTFDDQKNAVRGETTGHGRNGHPILCPHAALLSRVLHLRLHQAPPTTPLYTFYGSDQKARPIYTRDVTMLLRRGASEVKAITGIDPKQVTSYSLRSGGATTLLCSGVDENLIRLLGRWKSDAMFRYLRVQATSLTHNLSNTMLAYGSFSFQPKIQPQDLPSDTKLPPKQYANFIQQLMEQFSGHQTLPTLQNVLPYL